MASPLILLGSLGPFFLFFVVYTDGKNKKFFHKYILPCTELNPISPCTVHVVSDDLYTCKSRISIRFVWCMSYIETLKVLMWFTAIVNNNMTGITLFFTATHDLFHRAPIFTAFLHTV
jgi:hypothetical protein